MIGLCFVVGVVVGLLCVLLDVVFFVWGWCVVFVVLLLFVVVGFYICMCVVDMFEFVVFKC